MHKEPNKSADMTESQTPETADTAGSALPSHRPLGSYVIAGVVGLEALALGAATVWAIVSAAVTPAFSVASGIFLIVLLAAMTAGMSAVAVNAFKGMRWTRSASFVWQLLMVALAVPALLEGNIVLGLVMLLPAVACAYYLFTPTVVAFSQRTSADADGAGTPVL